MLSISAIVVQNVKTFAICLIGIGIVVFLAAILVDVADEYKVDTVSRRELFAAVGSLLCIAGIIGAALSGVIIRIRMGA